jgi:uncharacterized protein YdeI (YjbR/CyaY-like superfamily)
MKNISGGTAHTLPQDLRTALMSNLKILEAWQSLTPLSRNEWICWIISVKRAETRREHIERACAQLKAGKRRPCCWYGCIHRTDKTLNSSQKYLLKKRAIT